MLHGDRSQSERERALTRFRQGASPILVATDVAARGIDVDDIRHVIQLDTTTAADDYVHRIGRTGRAGASGVATALINGKQLSVAAALRLGMEEVGQPIPLWLAGMAHVHAAREHAELSLIERGGGSGGRGEQQPTGAFEGEDFRSSAAVGSWGAERDVSYSSFDVDAYADVVPVASVALEASEASDAVVEAEASEAEALEAPWPTTARPARAARAADAAAMVGAQADRSGKLAEGSTGSGVGGTQRSAGWLPPQVPAELRRELSRYGHDGSAEVGRAPQSALLRTLQRLPSQRLFFEYCGLFERATLAAALHPPADTSGDASLRKILMVTEKPSISEALAKALYRPGRRGAEPRRVRGVSRAIPVYEFIANHACADGVERKCVIKITSTVGHIFGLSFKGRESAGGDAGGGDAGGRASPQRLKPGEYFTAGVVKSAEGTSEKLRVVDHLRAAAAGCDELALWLDCDREGENIAHEVMAVTRSVFRDVGSQVRRARFSSLQADELREAARQLPSHLPDAAASLAVDARQELDLRAGVAFTRLLTQRCAKQARQLLGPREGPELRVLSWGPCQSPTLHFVVQRYDEVTRFERRPTFAIDATASHLACAPLDGRRSTRSTGSESVPLALRWLPSEGASEVDDPRPGERITTLDGDEARAVAALLHHGATGHVLSTASEQRTYQPPEGLNTVKLLQACSKALGLSPKRAMAAAEKLYSGGVVSYPRTETTRYSSGFELSAVLRDHTSHPDWGRVAVGIESRRRRRQSGGGGGRSAPQRPRGRDAGDHPPITPTRVLSRGDVSQRFGGIEWKVYEYICRHFLGSLGDPLRTTRYRAIASFGQDDGGRFLHLHTRLDDAGFGGAMPWAMRDAGLLTSEDGGGGSGGQRSGGRGRGGDGGGGGGGGCSGGDVGAAAWAELREGDALTLHTHRLVTSQTEPPPFLQEHELLALMDIHGIGTDASMATHVSTIGERNYACVVDETGEPIRPPRPHRPGQPQPPRQRGRYLVPTPLGLGMIRALQTVEPELCSPQIRARMEGEVGRIARGELDKQSTLDANIDFFRGKFDHVSSRVGEVQEALQATVHPNRDHLRALVRSGAFGTAAAAAAEQGAPRGGKQTGKWTGKQTRKQTGHARPKQNGLRGSGKGRR